MVGDKICESSCNNKNCLYNLEPRKIKYVLVNIRNHEWDIEDVINNSWQENVNFIKMWFKQ